MSEYSKITVCLDGFRGQTVKYVSVIPFDGKLMTIGEDYVLCKLLDIFGIWLSSWYPSLGYT